MLFAVSTVMDTPQHMRRYVEGNRAGGIDHLIVFLDKPRGPQQEETAAYLDSEPAVTCVRAGSGWWGEGRPRELNERQCTNANVAKRVLSDLGIDGWIFHLDSDEIARVDPAAVAGVPPDATALRLGVREAVSRTEWPGEPTLFKRELPDADLELLAGLGLVAEPSNQAYFRGHLMGKSGARISAPAWLTLHKVVDDEGAGVAMHDGDGLEVFHYESYSAEEFIRKWTAMVASGPRAAYRPERKVAARTLRALISRGLEPDALRRQLLRYYDRFVAEEVDALHDLGVLVEFAPSAAPAQPALIEDRARQLADGLESWRGRPKGEHFHGSSPVRTGGQGSSGRSWSRLGAALGTSRSGSRAAARSSSSASSERSSERK